MMVRTCITEPTFTRYWHVVNIIPYLVLITSWLLDCSDGQIRLVGGSNDAEGTIEICFNSLWGVISATTWTDANTQVTCKQLGYTGNHTC